MRQTSLRRALRNKNPSSGSCGSNCLTGCGNSSVHPSRASERTERSLNILKFSDRAEPIEAGKSSFSAVC